MRENASGLHAEMSVMHVRRRVERRGTTDSRLLALIVPTLVGVRAGIASPRTGTVVVWPANCPLSSLDGS